jgi:ankyrin repeat protein
MFSRLTDKLLNNFSTSGCTVRGEGDELPPTFRQPSNTNEKAKEVSQAITSNAPVASTTSTLLSTDWIVIPTTETPVIPKPSSSQVKPQQLQATEGQRKVQTGLLAEIDRVQIEEKEIESLQEDLLGLLSTKVLPSSLFAKKTDHQTVAQAIRTNLKEISGEQCFDIFSNPAIYDAKNEKVLQLILKYLPNTKRTEESVSYGVNAGINERAPSIICKAAKVGERKLVEFLINFGARTLDTQDTETPLTIAIKNDYQELAKFLVEISSTHGEDLVNLISGHRYSKTPLSVALEKENYEMAKLLLERNANPYKYSSYQTNAVGVALQKGRQALDFLSTHVVLFTHEALKAKEFYEPHYTFGTLVTQAGHGPLESLQWLKEQGFDLHYAKRKSSSSSETAFQGAVRFGKMENIEYLLQEGANINQVNTTGETPLYSLIKDASNSGARFSYSLTVAEHLISKGADSRITPKGGKTIAEMLSKMRTGADPKLLAELTQVEKAIQEQKLDN